MGMLKQALWVRRCVKTCVLLREETRESDQATDDSLAKGDNPDFINYI